MHPMTAVPIELPSVWLVVNNPDAVFWDSSSIPFMDTSIPRAITRPNPMPKRNIPGAMSRKVTCNPNWNLRITAPIMASTNPIDIRILWLYILESLSASSADIRTPPVAGIRLIPVSNALNFNAPCRNTLTANRHPIIAIMAMNLIAMPASRLLFLKMPISTRGMAPLAFNFIS